ncbi:MAG: hypothetical protein JSV33_13140 [bacterium]|nr:MAG: hypothetical protein JSV33_13140 [bacterium]
MAKGRKHTIPWARFRIVIFWTILLTAGCGKLPIINKIIDNDTLSERVSGAEIIIIGKLSSVEERGLIEEEMRFGEGQYYKHYLYYDLGKIEVQEALKGSYEKGSIFIKFLSFDQTQPHPLSKADCRHFSYHNIWNIGIWLIDIEKVGEPRFKVQRGNYVPLERLEDVKAVIDSE